MHNHLRFAAVYAWLSRLTSFLPALFFFWATTPCCKAAQEPASSPVLNAGNHFAIEIWTTENGLPQNMVTAIIQTQQGYLWAATYNGIAQFDGVSFKIFDTSTAEALTNSRITSLFEDASGGVWIGHDTGDITLYSDGAFSPVLLPRGWGRGMVAGICADQQDALWCVSLRGDILRLKDGLKLSPPPEMAAEPVVLPQLATDKQHHLYLARNGRVAEISEAGFRRISFPSEATNPYYARIAAAAAGGWWVSGDGRVRRWADNQWQEDLGPFPWGEGFTTSMMESSSGHVLVGTLDRGVFIYDSAAGWMSLNRNSGLPHDWVRCIAEDREKNIWLGTGGGLVVLRPRKVEMLSPPDKWQGRPVQAITMAHDGAIWAATEGAGVYRFKADEWTQLSGDAGLLNNFAWAMMEDSSRKVWAGTWGGGLYTWDGKKFVQQFDLQERGEPVTALLEHPPGTLWIGTPTGLLRARSGHLTRLSPLGGAASGDVRALAVARGGGIWIGTQGQGLGRIKEGKLRTYTVSDGLPRNFLLSLYDDADGSLWIGTLDRGLCRFKDGKFKTLTADQGLPNNVIGHIADDDLGNLWFSSQQGIFRVQKTALHGCADGKIAMLRPLNFGKPEGLSNLACSSGFTPSGFRSPDGRLWFPTAQGIAVVDPSKVRRNVVPPHVWIEEMAVDGQASLAKKFQTGSGNLSTRLLKAVRLSPGQHQLEISFTGISFTSPARVLFRYRLEGLDADWSEPTSRRRVTYPFLPPGKFTFRVKACNSDGLWNEEGDSAMILVMPYFWQTWWFKTGAVIAALSLVGCAVYVSARRRSRLKLERIARERELERERARIAQDIHDDLGASLTRIGMLSQSVAADLHEPEQAAAQLNAIYTTARDLTRAMDEIVWAVNPRHDTLESLMNYVTRFAHDFLSAAHIRCRIEAPLTLPELTVHSEIRHNLFLAFKETLNNVVKHSGACEVHVSLELLPQEIKLTISDNGSGFEPGRSASAAAGNRVLSGHGVTGMRSRLAQIGGRVEIASRPGQGTHVHLFSPLRSIENCPAPVLRS